MKQLWIHESKEYNEIHDPKLIGFVYLITNLTNGRQYIGKKLFHSSKTKQIKGRKKKFKVESDWRDYFGSSEELKNDVLTLGQNSFKREILHLCYSKGNCNYLELREQIDRRVMELDQFYNSFVGGKIHKKHVKL